MNSTGYLLWWWFFNDRGAGQRGALLPEGLRGDNEEEEPKGCDGDRVATALKRGHEWGAFTQER
jgi:hypothetical protein